MTKERILIAEDEPVVRDVCVRATREDGYEIQVVASGAEAIKAAREQPFDLFLTDVRMPGMSGLEAFRAIQEFYPDIVGVAMTGYATMEAAIEALQLGFHDFILKPFSPDEVRRAVARALERKRLRRENARLKALIPFYKLTEAFMAITSVDDLLQEIIGVAVQEGNVDVVAILLFDPAQQTYKVRAAVGLPAEAMGRQLGPAQEQTIRHILETTLPTTWSGDQVPDLPFTAGVQELLAVPLITQGHTFGLMLVGRRTRGATLAGADTEMFSVLAGQAAVAIRNAQLFSEIQEAYKKVEESDHLKSEFIAIASHELRTPLVSILGYIEMLTYEARAEMLQHLNIVLGEAMRLRDVVNDMLSLTDLQAGMAQIQWESVYLDAVMARVVDALRAHIEAKRVRVRTDIPPDCVIIQGDRERLELILSKLMSNAIKFSPQGATVEVGAKREARRVIISVMDHGPGIPYEAQENLFRPFYQVDEALRRTHSGVGLGLSIAKGMVELHGGEIWVESEPGKGSSFFFSVPQPSQAS